MNTPHGEFILEEGVNYTFPQIMDLLEQHSSVVMTIQATDIERLKSGLSIRKSRRNKILKENEIPMESLKLSYTPIGEADALGWIQLRIDLKAVQGVTVKGLNIPGEF